MSAPIPTLNASGSSGKITDPTEVAIKLAITVAAMSLTHPR